MTQEEYAILPQAIVNKLSKDKITEITKILNTHHLLSEIPEILSLSTRRAPAINDPLRMAELLIDQCGTELLRHPDIRKIFLECANDEQIASLKEIGQIYERRMDDTIAAIARKSWHSGKFWARTFVQTLGLPSCLAGTPNESERQQTEIIHPYAPLKPLHPFQEKMSRRMITLLSKRGNTIRAILTLPTGAGKTRIAVESIVSYLIKSKKNKTILWIAQSEELCEQAVVSFSEVWTDQMIRNVNATREISPLKIHRFWGSRGVPEIEPGDIVISSIQKLKAHSEKIIRDFESSINDEQDKKTVETLKDIVQNGIPGISDGFEFISDLINKSDSIEDTKKQNFEKLSSKILNSYNLELYDAIIIDEAHHSIAASYTPIFQYAKRNNIPIIGLTATPFRGNSSESSRLIKRYESSLIHPGFDNPIKTLNINGILSKIKIEPCSTGQNFILDAAEIRHLEKMHELSGKTLVRIGKDTKRNKAILERLVQIPTGKPVLFFGCSVEHAHLIALLLRRKKRTAAAITAETSDALRRLWIQEFRDGKIQFLCNVGVLTTGFDAPKIEIVAIARPTASPLLYEQMIGRGMRGPKNGGTKDCLVIDFTDKISDFKEPMSYARISKMWEESAKRIKEMAPESDESLSASEEAL